MNNDTLILVVTHKNFDQTIVPKDGYRIIKVGQKLSSEDAKKMGFLTDDDGDNIAEENPFYCELTAQYWAWKNIDPSIKYIGISHYRRYFFDYSEKAVEWKKNIVSAQRIKEILKDHKVIISFPSVKVPGFSMLYKNKPDDQQDKHWIVIRDIIKESYPEMYTSFEHIMYGRKTIYGNMLIARREVFDSYCDWIFDVLKKYDEVLKKRGEERISRVDGYLSEPLLLIWMAYNLQKEDVFHLEIRNTEADKFRDYQKGLTGRIIRSVRHNRTGLVLMQRIKVMLLYIIRR